MPKLLKSPNRQVFMIQHKESGLYARGTLMPSFGKEGRIFESKRSINGHVTATRSYWKNRKRFEVNKDHPYKNAEGSLD